LGGSPVFDGGPGVRRGVRPPPGGGFRRRGLSQPMSSPSRAKKGPASARRQVRLAPADKLKSEIHAVLTDELRSEEHRTGHGRYDGFAYPAAEAYFHLAGGYDSRPPPVA